MLGRKFGKGGGLNRDQVWLTSKLFNTDHEAARVPKALKETLSELQVSQHLPGLHCSAHSSCAVADLWMPAGGLFGPLADVSEHR